MLIPKGFSYAGIHAGLKTDNRRDMGIIVSDVPAICAGVTTTNQVAAACVHYNRLILKQGKAKTIIVNTKFANACTGKQGDADNLAVAQKAAELFGGPVLTASTGVIGKPMPMDKLLKGVEILKNNLEKDGDHFAEAVLTTDLTIKKISKKLNIAGKDVILAGVAKGSGMIHPNMATMLAFVTTDAAIKKNDLQKMIKTSADNSFNQITVDGDTSTNDMLLCLANGASGVAIDNSNLEQFRNALDEILIYLAKEIARDGEGATKLIEVRVKDAKSVKDARIIAKTIAGSPLVKCAVYGEDDNWGRVIAAAGRAGVKILPDKVKMQWTGLKTKEVLIEVSLGMGKYSGTAWGCDLTEGYVKINADYN